MWIIFIIKYMLFKLLSMGIYGIIRYLFCLLDIIVKFDIFDSNVFRFIDLYLDKLFLLLKFFGV